jgi:alpha-glucosidase
MVDWTNPDAAAWWHENRRKHLIDEGVVGHWTDLGEPEMFQASAWYYGFPEYELHGQADIHNLYNFLWSKSIWEGYQRDGVTRRPFIMSRSGTAGSQRYGVAMWSGDIGANMPSLAAHMNAQMQMSLSGMDYFGSDVGGFYRQAFDLKISKDDMYTVWLANSSLLDVPLRPHTSNVNNEFQTAPALNGDVASNLANVRFRYMLTPYLYTLAHRAYSNAEPVFAPLVYYFQADPNVRTLGNQKMIGPDLMMAAITDNTNIDSVHTYLPAGGWFNVYTGEFVESAGEWIDVPTLVDGVRRAPLFARDGAIIPMMPVDDQTMNTLGKRRDGSTNDTLILNVYRASEDGSTTIIDDDGETMAYQNGDVWQTTVTSAESDTGVTVIVAPQETASESAPAERSIEIRLVSPNAAVTSVLINGAEQPVAESLDTLAAQDTGWVVDEAGVIHVKSGTMDVGTALEVVFKE